MSRATRLESQLKAVFSPQLFEIHDESHMHSGPNHETHFKLILVSDHLLDMGRVKRHQAVYGQIQGEMESGLHAIALHLFTPSEWSDIKDAPDSPSCRGGE